ncbi:hypothetical protein V5097_20395 [Arenibacter palladensis]
MDHRYQLAMSGNKGAAAGETKVRAWLLPEGEAGSQQLGASYIWC